MDEGYGMDPDPARGGLPVDGDQLRFAGTQDNGPPSIGKADGAGGGRVVESQAVNVMKSFLRHPLLRATARTAALFRAHAAVPGGRVRNHLQTHQTMKIITPSSISALLLLFSIPSHAALLLQAPVMGGTQESVYWEYFEGSGDNHGLGSGNPTGTPASGTGTISPVGPGFPAGAGYYSYMGSFGITATTQAISISDIQNVVFQRVSMANPDFSIDQNLNWDGTAIIGTEPDPSMGAAPSITLGGPWLSYFDASGTLLGRVQATATAVMASSVGVSLGGFDGDLCNFAYQWDLSGVTEEVKSVQIDAPIMVHSSTVEGRIDISDSYVQVVPEPSVLLSLSAAGGLLLVRRRR